MHAESEVRAALDRARSGASASIIGAQLGIPRTTVRGWLAGEVPGRLPPGACPACRGEHAFDQLTPAYGHLLGLYLGDGCLSVHPRGVYKLRLSLDAKYPGIVRDAVASIDDVRGRPAGQRITASNCVEVYSYWRQWVCYFPQHGPGPKHRRPIVLKDWQRTLVDRWPEQLLRGLIESDGCRFQNSGRCGWSHPRYSFSNHSADIHAIFRQACAQLGLRWTEAKPYTTYVSRVADVARLDAFVGPKR